ARAAQARPRGGARDSGGARRRRSRAPRGLTLSAELARKRQAEPQAGDHRGRRGVTEDESRDEERGRRQRGRKADEAGDRQPRSRRDQPLLVVLAKADAVVRGRGDEARDRAEREQERREPDVALQCVGLLEAVVERDDEQEREQDLNAGQREAKLLEELLELAVEAVGHRGQSSTIATARTGDPYAGSRRSGKP